MFNRSLWRKEDYKKNPEKYREANLKYYYNNKEKCNWSWKKYKYGITKEDYKNILEKQNNICPICNQELIGKIVIDHDPRYEYITGKKKVRGILHEECNHWLGWLEKYCRLLPRSIKYLKESNAQKEDDE